MKNVFPTYYKKKVNGFKIKFRQPENMAIFYRLIGLNRFPLKQQKYTYSYDVQT